MAPTDERNDSPGWLLDQVGAAGRENLDPDHVARYDQLEDANAAAEVELCRRLGLGSEAVVVDFGAGTGQFALAAATTFGRVIAVDVSPPMLERLCSKAGGAGAERIEFVEAGFLNYEHAGAPADLAYSRYALHHVPDFWKGVALARIHRLLKPQGLMRLWDVVYNFEPAEAEERIEAWCSTAERTADEDEWNRGDLEEHVRDEHSTYTWALEPMIERVGFGIEQAEYSDDGIFAQYVLRRT